MRKQSIPIVWSEGRVGKDKEDIEYVLKNNRILIERLLEILEKYDQEEFRAEVTLSEYDSPSWSHKQADRNGARRAFRKVRQLFQF